MVQFKKFLQDKFELYNDNLPFIITMFIAFILVMGGVTVFIELTEDLSTKILASYDKGITEYIVSYRNPSLTSILTFITDVGDLTGYLVVSFLISAFFYWKFRNWRYIIELLSVLILASLSNVILKQIINRARPTEHTLMELHSLSYPSGHSMSAMAFYGFLIYLCYLFKMKTWIKVLLISILSVIILLIGISRIYLGVHYPSDVVGGFIAGAIWVIFCAVLFHIIDLLRKRKRKKEPTPEPEPELEH